MREHPSRIRNSDDENPQWGTHKGFGIVIQFNLQIAENEKYYS